MSERVASSSDDTQLARVCDAAEERTAALGHALGPWEEPEEGIARRAACTKCGRAVYARAEGKLSGMAGRAVVEPCDGSVQ